VHIIDDITVAAIPGGKVCLHDEIGHGVKEGLVVDSFKRKAVGAF
jgi:hypothetical protein